MYHIFWSQFELIVYFFDLKRFYRINNRAQFTNCCRFDFCKSLLKISLNGYFIVQIHLKIIRS